MSIAALGANSALDELGIVNKTQEEAKSNELGQRPLELMITQWKIRSAQPQENWILSPS